MDPLMGGVLGIDIGGVITEIPKGSNRADESFLGKNHLHVPKVDDAFTTIGKLLKHCRRVVLIARAGERAQRDATDWFRDQRFFEQTGLREGDVFYTSTRDHKVRVALEQEVTHVIDDKLEVLAYMSGHIRNLIAFRASPSDKLKYRYTSDQLAHHADSWQKVGELLIPKETAAT